MSTKLNPGDYDCYKKLAPDEPYFLLRAKDPNGPALVELWAALREAQYGPYPKLDEARAVAQEMREWKRAHPEAKPTIPHVSALACGCDPSADWVCERHRVKSVAAIPPSEAQP